MEHKSHSESQEHSELSQESPEQFKLSIPTVEDAEGAAEVMRETWRATYPNEEAGITEEDIETKIQKFTPESLEKAFKRVEKDPEEKIWIVKEGEKVVGVCRAFKKNNEPKIGALYVLPKYQGRGIGHKLMHEALHWLGENNDIVVAVAAYNHAAQEFYKKFGFEITDNSVHSDAATLPSGKVIEEVEMKRSGGLF